MGDNVKNEEDSDSESEHENPPKKGGGKGPHLVFGNTSQGFQSVKQKASLRQGATIVAKVIVLILLKTERNH